MNWDAFFTLHSDLPREGPGLPEDVAWAAEKADVGPVARILDAGSGPGGDVASLLALGPGVHVTAIDTHAPFIEDVARRFPTDRVHPVAGNMLDVSGPYDLIWCAGAIYFTGIAATLEAWRSCLAPDGHVAFTYPAYFSQAPSAGARAFWGDDENMVFSAEKIGVVVDAVGFSMVAGRPLSPAAWEAYYTPMSARIAALRPGATAELSAALDDSEREMNGWRTHQKETGYWLAVVRPKTP